MGIILILLYTISVVHNGKAVIEHLTTEESEGNECSFETCGSNPLPIPLMQRQINQAEATEFDFVEDTETTERPIFWKDMETNFTCDDKPYIPGLYGDMETDCQVFHLCMNNTVDHFLCPEESGFDQKNLTCKIDGKQYCQQTPNFYTVNENMTETFPIISGIEEFDMKKDVIQSYYQKLKDLQNASSQQFPEREVIRILILLQFFEVSSLMPDIIIVEETDGYGRAIDASETAKSLLDLIIDYIFPLFSMRNITDQLISESANLPAEPRTTHQRAKAKSVNESDSWGDFVQSESQGGSEGSSEVASLGTFYNTTATNLGAKMRENASLVETDVPSVTRFS